MHLDSESRCARGVDRVRVTLLNLFVKHGGAETCARSLLAGLIGRGHEAKLLVGRMNVDPGALTNRVAALPSFLPEFLLQRALSRVIGLTDAFMLRPLWLARSHPDLIHADIVHF